MGNKTLDGNKQNTTEKPIKMRTIKNGQSRNTGNIVEIKHWTKTNKTQTEKPIKMRAIKNGQSRDTGNIGK